MSESVATPLAYRIPQFAKLVGVSRSFVWAEIQRGRLQAKKLGGATLILHEEGAAYLKAAPPTKPSQ